MGCGCLVFLASAISPRLGIFLLWLFSDRMTQAFDSGWLAIVGFLLLPWTTLAWAVAYQPLADIRVSGFGWIVVGVALLADLSSLAGSGKARSSR